MSNPSNASERVLRPLTAFAQHAFAAASCPAAIVAISTAEAEDILSASLDAKAKVRGTAKPDAGIEDLTLLEMDYAFTNLGFFLSRVGDYRESPLTLAQWNERPRAASIYYAVEILDAEGTGLDKAAREIPSAVAAVLGDRLVSKDSPEPVAIDASPHAGSRIGQVFAITPMADARWSA